MKQLIDFGSEYLLLSRLGLTGEQAAIIVTHQHMMSANGPGTAPVGFKDEKMHLSVSVFRSSKIDGFDSSFI